MHFLRQFRKKIISAMRVKKTLINKKPNESATKIKEAEKRLDPLQPAEGDTHFQNNCEPLPCNSSAMAKSSFEPDSSVMGGGDVPDCQNGDGSSDSQKTLPDTQPVDSDDTVTSSLDYYNNQVRSKISYFM